MMPWAPAAVHVSAAATPALISAAWEGALLAAVVLVVLRLLPRLSAAARSVIWLNVFALLALLHFVPLTIHSTHPALASHAVRLDLRWSLVVAALWLALSLWRAAALVRSALHLRHVARAAQPVEAAACADLLRLKSGRVVQLCTSPHVARPSVLGFLRPRILLPPDLLERLTTPELRQVVVHEMEHLHRHDDWTNLLQKLALVLFPLNPALAWVERRLCAERELACDDRVLASGSGRKAYALCLAHLAEHGMLRRGYALVLGAWERRPELVRRVQRILSHPARSMSRPATLAVSGTLVAGALGCTLVLAHAPQIVRFAPAMQQARTLAPINPRELGLAGTPQFVRATLPPRSATVQRAREAAAAVPTDRARTDRTHRGVRAVQAVHNRAVQHRVPPSRLADLRMPPPQPGNLVILAEWSDGVPARVVIAVSGAQQPPPVTVTRAVYAVATPSGWIVLQI